MRRQSIFYRLYFRGKKRFSNTCGKNGSDKDTEELGGVLEFDHKTAPVLKIMSLADAKSIKKKTDRKGGQGIIVGMAETR